MQEPSKPRIDEFSYSPANDNRFKLEKLAEVLAPFQGQGTYICGVPNHPSQMRFNYSRRGDQDRLVVAGYYSHAGGMAKLKVLYNFQSNNKVEVRILGTNISGRKLSESGDAIWRLVNYAPPQMLLNLMRLVGKNYCSWDSLL
ncbi:hypothetical protein CMO93_04300 [Candidatus Woesearchaeota archaeon]|nr:hypothetical protein [Candidatus Woesearchaeota archaeon]